MPTGKPRCLITHSRLEWDLEMLNSVSSACTCFKIAFVCKGFFLVTKSDSCFNILRCKFGGVGDVPGVVHCQAFLQIMRYACVVVHAGGDITKNVDVVEMRGRHKHRCIWYLRHVTCHGGLPASAHSCFSVAATLFYFVVTQ